MGTNTTAQKATRLVGAPVDERGALDVRSEESVDGVLLGQLAVHGHHRGLHNDMRVAEVGDRLVEADWRKVGKQSGRSSAMRNGRGGHWHAVGCHRVQLLASEEVSLVVVGEKERTGACLRIFAVKKFSPREVP